MAATILHDGVRLVYEENGAGDPPFVFVHGGWCDRSFFAPQAAYFAPRHRVVSPDLRGHGESDRPHGSYPIAAYADDIADLIDQLLLGRVIAIGHSMGALAVLQLAATYPDSVAAIVMVDPAPLVISSELRVAFESIAAAMEAGDQEPRRKFITDLFLPHSDRALIEKVLRVMLAVPSDIAVAAMRGVLEFDGPAIAAQCKVPALHVAAAVPLNPPHLMSEWLPGVINGWTVGAGHFNQLEVPDQVNAMIELFVRHYVAKPAAVGMS